jgi:hypothetical protein
MSAGEKSDSTNTPRGFAVTDRRSFTDEGQTRASDPAPAAEPKPAGEPEAAGEARATGPRAGRSARLPPVDFPTFVLSLGSSVLMHLGEAPHPGSGETAKDLVMAKHTIDILSMLEQKTKGNLNASEAELMENLLYDLRLRYVEAAKK